MAGASRSDCIDVERWLERCAFRIEESDEEDFDENAGSEDAVLEEDLIGEDTLPWGCLEQDPGDDVNALDSLYEEFEQCAHAATLGSSTHV